MRLPRHIKAESIHIGDVIRVTEKVNDVEVSTTGKVADRQHYGQHAEYRSADGVLMLVTVTGHASPKITLLQEAETRGQPTLF